MPSTQERDRRNSNRDSSLYVVHLAIAKRSSSSGGSSDSPRTTFTTDPRPDGVNVMKYDPCDADPIVNSVAPLFFDACTRESRLSRQCAISDVARADAT